MKPPVRVPGVMRSFSIFTPMLAAPWATTPR